MEWRGCARCSHIEVHSLIQVITSAATTSSFLPATTSQNQTNNFQDLWIVIAPVRKLATGSPYFRSGENLYLL